MNKRKKMICLQNKKECLLNNTELYSFHQIFNINACLSDNNNNNNNNYQGKTNTQK